jgi:hypothetical protein
MTFLFNGLWNSELISYHVNNYSYLLVLYLSSLIIDDMDECYVINYESFICLLLISRNFCNCWYCQPLNVKWTVFTFHNKTRLPIFTGNETGLNNPPIILWLRLCTPCLRILISTNSAKFLEIPLLWRIKNYWIC